MDRALFAAALVIAGSLGCSPAFKDKRTPSGDFCSDMPIVPAGQEPEREYHRLQPIQSDPKAHTEAERLESLRKAACKIDADAVIEAVNEEVRGENAQYATVSGGTAVIWLRHSDTGPAPAMQILAPPKKPTPIGATAPDGESVPAPAVAVDVAVAPEPPPAAKPGVKPAAAKAKPLGKQPTRPVGSQ